MIDDGTLIEYADTFRTRGNRAGGRWFVGLEESGGESAADVARRLDRWVAAGRPEREALDAGDPGDPGTAALDADRPGGAKLHPTWAAQIRVRLGIEARPDDVETIRRLQVSDHGTAGGETCLTELLPLPSPSASRWLYGKFSREPRLASREACQAHYLEPRLDRLDALVREHRPGTIALLCWAQRDAIAPFLDDVEAFTGDAPSRPGRALVGTWGDTAAAITYPPSFPFTSANRFYRELGARLRERADASAAAPGAPRSRAA